MFRKCFFALMLYVTIVLLGCTSNEIGYSKEVSPEAVYFDYTIWGDEESGNVTAKFQYRFGGPNGTTLVLEDPAKVEFDGELLPVDSSRMNGDWYEVNRLLKNFVGRQQVLYNDR